MDEFFKSIVTFFNINKDAVVNITAALTGISVLIIILKKMKRPLIIITTKTASLYNWCKRIVNLKPTLDKLALEFRPNGGSSFRDAIDRIEKQVTIDVHRFDRLETSVEQVRRDTAAATERFWATYDSEPNGLWEADEMGKVVRVNNTLVAMMGLSGQEEVLGNGWVNGICGRDREYARAEFLNALRDKRSFSIKYTTTINIDIECIGKILLDKQTGFTTGWMGTIKKI